MQRSEVTEKYSRHSSAREAIIKILRVLHLNRVAARLYYGHFHGFDSAEKDLPAVIHRCLRRAAESGIADRGDIDE